MARVTEDGALERTLAERRSIYDALVRGDPAMAPSWATVHIAGVEQWLRTTLA